MDNIDQKNLICAILTNPGLNGSSNLIWRFAKQPNWCGSTRVSNLTWIKSDVKLCSSVNWRYAIWRTSKLKLWSNQVWRCAKKLANWTGLTRLVASLLIYIRLQIPSSPCANLDGLKSVVADLITSELNQKWLSQIWCDWCLIGGLELIWVKILNANDSYAKTCSNLIWRCAIWSLSEFLLSPNQTWSVARIKPSWAGSIRIDASLFTDIRLQCPSSLFANLVGLKSVFVEWITSNLKTSHLIWRHHI